MKGKYRSDLSKAKNLGAASSGSHHWWHQRFTALIISIMIFWVISFFGEILKSNVTMAISHLKKPFNLAMLLVLFLTVMYHAVLGMQVVIEDYMSCRTYRLVLILAIQIFAIITAASFALATFYVMVL